MISRFFDTPIICLSATGSIDVEVVSIFIEGPWLAPPKEAPPHGKRTNTAAIPARFSLEAISEVLPINEVYFELT